MGCAGRGAAWGGKADGSVFASRPGFSRRRVIYGARVRESCSYLEYEPVVCYELVFYACMCTAANQIKPVSVGVMHTKALRILASMHIAIGYT